MKYILIPLLPFLSFLINILLGRKLIRDRAHWIAVPAVIGSFVLAVSAFIDVLGGQVIHLDVYTWISSGNFQVSFGFLIDQLSAIMLMVVTSISSLIFIYSIGYMHGDGGYYRFFAYLSLFVFSMLVLVMANNFLLLYFGWEAVGLCSYFLIGFWFHKKSAADAGKKAFIVNRFGDFGFGLAIIIIFLTFGSLDYLEVFGQAGGIIGQTVNIFGSEVSLVTLICLLLFCGAVGKSAQVPLHVWLPDAMEGPTPVSALIHAATMVTAGVFMVARCNPLFNLSETAMNTVAIVGGVTALFAATIALVQNDIKRVIAYSTVSQLGYMFLALGVGAYSAGIFHLYTHAYFKALLFLASGSVIHALHDEQNMQNMGGLKKYMPITYWVFIAATLSITGIPGFAGFFSKDEILWRTYQGWDLGRTLWIMGTAAALLTAFYSWRLIYLTFHGTFRGSHEQEHHLHESPRVITVPLILLAIGAVFAGYVGVPPLIGEIFHYEQSDQIGAFLSPVLGHAEGHGTHAEELLVMGASVFVALFGWLIAHTMYARKTELPQKLGAMFQPLYRLLLNKYYIDELYSKTIVQPVISASDKIILGIFDMKIIEGIVNGVPALIGALSRKIRTVQTGMLSNYALVMAVGAVLIVGIWIYLR